MGLNIALIYWLGRIPALGSGCAGEKQIPRLRSE
jgi:hypothetical protein